jgi:hypothetical protein
MTDNEFAEFCTVLTVGFDYIAQEAHQDNLSFYEKNVRCFYDLNSRRMQKGLDPFTLQEYIDDYERRVGVRLTPSCFQA